MIWCAPKSNLSNFFTYQFFINPFNELDEIGLLNTWTFMCVFSIFREKKTNLYQNTSILKEVDINHF